MKIGIISDIHSNFDALKAVLEYFNQITVDKIICLGDNIPLKKQKDYKKGENMFKLYAPYKPTGDQPQAIEYLSNGIKEGKKFQTLLGVTGSRKNIYYGKHNRKSSKTNTCFST